MLSSLLIPLQKTLKPHFSLSNSRLMTLCVLIVGVVNGRTINLSHLAAQFPGDALHSSNYRRLQRFFQYTHFDRDTIARLIITVLGQSSKRYLAIDRTTWFLGKRVVNVLVLAIVTRRFRVPVSWILLKHKGCSSATDRIQLVERYIELFGLSSIKVLLADREFIGMEWLEFLLKNNVPFAIRLKGERKFHEENGRLMSLASKLRKPKSGTWCGWLHGMQQTPEYRVHIVGKRLKSDMLFIVTNIPKPKQALSAYRHRWAIECLFSDTKTRGLNLEDTRITDPRKMSTVLAVIALAIVWAYRCATKLKGLSAIRKKSHGRKEKSWFRVGFDALRNWIINKPDKAIAAWSENCPRDIIL